MRRTRVLFDALMAHQASLFATDLGVDAPVLKLCRRFQTEFAITLVGQWV